jgi:hypothetical protein
LRRYGIEAFEFSVIDTADSQQELDGQRTPLDRTIRIAGAERLQPDRRRIYGRHVQRTKALA